MEIIKRGLIPDPQKYVGQCHNCGTVFKAELKECNLSQRDGYFAPCPLCNSSTNVVLKTSSEGTKIITSIVRNPMQER